MLLLIPNLFMCVVFGSRKRKGTRTGCIWIEKNWVPFLLRTQFLNTIHPRLVHYLSWCQGFTSIRLFTSECFVLEFAFSFQALFPRNILVYGAFLLWTSLFSALSACNMNKLKDFFQFCLNKQKRLKLHNELVLDPHRPSGIVLSRAKRPTLNG